MIRRSTNNFFRQKRVSLFFVVASSVTSLLHKMLHGLKEAPDELRMVADTGANLRKRRLAVDCDRGQISYLSFQWHQPAGERSLTLKYSGSSASVDNQRLLPDGQRPVLPSGFAAACTRIVILNTAPARRVTLTAQSGKVTHKIHVTAPVNSTAPAQNGILTLTFQPF